MRRAILYLGLSAFAFAGCGSGSGDSGSGGDPIVAEARASFPHLLALHETAIARSCSPSGGVCHNNLEYPDLHTPRNLLAAIGRPCNVARANDPDAIFDGCEPGADELVVPELEWRASIAVFGIEEWDGEARALFRQFAVDQPAPRDLGGLSARIERSGELVSMLPDHVRMQAGSRQGKIERLATLDYRALESVRAGDPNHNGVVGSHDPWQVIAPGKPEKSYLVGRLLGTVPGDRMPLANEPLSDAELTALFCWIETLGVGAAAPGALDPIDYDRCAFAGGTP